MGDWLFIGKFFAFLAKNGDSCKISNRACLVTGLALVRLIVLKGTVPSSPVETQDLTVTVTNVTSIIELQPHTLATTT